MPSSKGDGKESNADSGGLGSDQYGELLGREEKRNKQRKDNMSETSTVGNYRESYNKKKIL